MKLSKRKIVLLLFISFLGVMVWWNFATIKAWNDPISFKPLTGPVALNCPHRAKEETTFGEMVKIMLPLKINKNKWPEHLDFYEQEACRDIFKLDYLFHLNDNNIAEYNIYFLYEDLGSLYLFNHDYRDDLLATILHRAADNDIWGMDIFWISTRAWLGMIYSNTSSRMYNPIMAEHQFRRIIVGTLFIYAGYDNEECIYKYKKEKEKPYAIGPRLKAIEWAGKYCSDNYPDPYIEAEKYEKGLGGYPQDLYMAYELYSLSTDKRSQDKKQELRAIRDQNPL